METAVLYSGIADCRFPIADLQEPDPAECPSLIANHQSATILHPRRGAESEGTNVSGRLDAPLGHRGPGAKGASPEATAIPKMIEEKELELRISSSSQYRRKRFLLRTS